LLGAEVRDSRTRTPYFAFPARPWTPSDILHELPKSDSDRDDVLPRAIRKIETEKEDRPLWQVVRYVPETELEEGYLAISAQHELMDGGGLLRLVQCLIYDDIPSLPAAEKFDTALGMQGAEYKPSLGFLLPIIYREKVIPALPTWLSTYLRPSPTWPANIDEHPSTAPWDFSVLSIDPTTVKAISATGKRKGVKTLHPVLKVAYLQAMREVYGPSSPGCVFVGESPRNERSNNPGDGHSYLAGNYVSAASWTLPSTGDFWEWCNTYSTYLSTTGISDGRQSIGLLSYLPDPDPPAKSDDPRRSTGWEDDYLTKFENRTNTYSQSLSFSNLGRVSLAKASGAVDLVWGFPGSPFAPPLSLAVVGHEAGLRIYTTWREGCPVTGESVGEVELAFKRIIEEHAEDQES